MVKDSWNNKYHINSECRDSSNSKEITTLRLLSDGEYGIVKGIKREHLSEPETTYNFEVEDFHTYYVGENGVCVHNLNCGDIYKSVKDHPNFDPDFSPAHKTTFKTMTNQMDLYDDLVRVDPGKWMKAYQNGFIDGQKYSMHFFQNTTNKHVFSLKYKPGWVT